MNKTLILHSGGLDSTSVLYRSLTKYSFPITVLNFHIRHYTTNIRASQEGRNQRKQIDWFKKNCREFVFEEIVLPANMALFRDTYPVLEACIPLIKSGKYDRIAYGVCEEEINCGDWRTVEHNTRPIFSSSGLNWDNIKWVPEEFKDRKAYKYIELPQELRDLLYWCRDPDEFEKACGTCRTCLKYESFKQEIKKLGK